MSLPLSRSGCQFMVNCTNADVQRRVFLVNGDSFTFDMCVSHAKVYAEYVPGVVTRVDYGRPGAWKSVCLTDSCLNTDAMGIALHVWAYESSDTANGSHRCKECLADLNTLETESFRTTYPTAGEAAYREYVCCILRYSVEELRVNAAIARGRMGNV